jgi:hypothetical protein
MFKCVIVLSALAFAAPGIAVAADNQPRSFNDLTATDPPANTFHGPPTFPPGLGGPPPGCSVLAADKDDAHHGSNGDDKNPDHGNPNCQPLSR